MSEEKKDVIDESSSSSETVVEESGSDDQEVKQEATNEDTPETSTPPAEANPPVESFDERGVPWKNVAMEQKRKLEDLAEKLPEMIDQGFQKYGGNAQERKMSIAELEAYALEQPQYRPWVEEQKEKLRQETLMKQLDEKLSAKEKAVQAESQKKASLAYVMQNYKDAFVKDAQGNLVSWNSGHALTREIGKIMQDPRFANDPEGLSAAADIAFARLTRANMGASKKTQEQLEDRVKNLQKATLIEGGGRQATQSAPPHRAAIDKLKQTGSMGDAQAAIAAINKARRASLESKE